MLTGSVGPRGRVLLPFSFSEEAQSGTFSHRYWHVSTGACIIAHTRKTGVGTCILSYIYNWRIATKLYINLL